jgi:hypothetical protein
LLLRLIPGALLLLGTLTAEGTALVASSHCAGARYDMLLIILLRYRLAG